MTRSVVPEIRALQRAVGAGRCPFCERPLKRKANGRPPQLCWRADCRAELHAAHWRRRKALAALSRSVRSLGAAVKRMGVWA